MICKTSHRVEETMFCLYWCFFHRFSNRISVPHCSKGKLNLYSVQVSRKKMTEALKVFSEISHGIDYRDLGTCIVRVFMHEFNQICNVNLCNSCMPITVHHSWDSNKETTEMFCTIFIFLISMRFWKVSQGRCLKFFE